MGIKDEITSASLLGQIADLDDQRAWDKFFGRYQPAIFEYCRRVGLNAASADEVTGEVLFRLAQAMPAFQYDPSKGFRKWLTTVVNNKIRDTWRKAARRIDNPAGGTIAHEMLHQVGADEEIEKSLTGLVDELHKSVDGDRQRLQIAMDHVRGRAPQTWNAFKLRKINGLSGAEVAKELGMSVAAVHVAVSRGMKMLHEAVASNDNIPKGPKPDGGE